MRCTCTEREIHTHHRKWLMDEYRSNLIPLNQIKCYQPHESSSLKINRFPPAQIKTLSLLQFRRNETFEQFSSENVLNSLNKYEKKEKSMDKSYTHTWKWPQIRFLGMENLKFNIVNQINHVAFEQFSPSFLLIPAVSNDGR